MRYTGSLFSPRFIPNLESTIHLTVHNSLYDLNIVSSLFSQRFTVQSTSQIFAVRYSVHGQLFSPRFGIHDTIHDSSVNNSPFILDIVYGLRFHDSVHDKNIAGPLFILRLYFHSTIWNLRWFSQRFTIQSTNQILPIPYSFYGLLFSAWFRTRFNPWFATQSTIRNSHFSSDSLFIPGFVFHCSISSIRYLFSPCFGIHYSIHEGQGIIL